MSSTDCSICRSDLSDRLYKRMVLAGNVFVTKSYDSTNTCSDDAGRLSGGDTSRHPDGVNMIAAHQFASGVPIKIRPREKSQLNTMGYWGVLHTGYRKQSVATGSDASALLERVRL